MIQRWDWLGDYERERIVSLTDGDYVLYVDHQAALEAATVRIAQLEATVQRLIAPVSDREWKSVPHHLVRPFSLAKMIETMLANRLKETTNA